MTCTTCDRAASRRGLCHRCYESHRNRQKLYGRWETSRVPAEPIRAHVQALRASGVGTRRIEELSGVSRSVIQSVSFGERYSELRELGFNDLQILGKFKIKAESLVRQIERYGFKASPELVSLACSRKHHRQAS
jgi:hypothetical protein